MRAAGTPLVRGLVYKAVCDGGFLHYCGSSPDLGAIASLSSAVTSRLAAGGKSASSSSVEKATAPAHAKTVKHAKTAKHLKVRSGTRFFTYKKNVKLRSGKTLHYTRGKGYYAA